MEKALLSLVLMLLLCPTLCASFDNALKAYESDDKRTKSIRWTTAEDEEDENADDEQNDDGMPTVVGPSRALQIQSLRGEKSEADDELSPIVGLQSNELSTNRQMSEFRSDDKRGRMVDVDIVKGRKGHWMSKDVADKLNNEWGHQRAEMPSISLVPKRRRRIGTAEGKQSTKSLFTKNAKMAKSPSMPTAFPDSGGIDLNVQSDFVEKNDDPTSEAPPPSPTTTTEMPEMEQQQKQRRNELEEAEEEKRSKSIEHGKDFWANALRTLLIEFRKMHPELINGSGGRRRTTGASSRTNSNTTTNTAEETTTTDDNDSNRAHPKRRNGGTTTDSGGNRHNGAWRGADNRLDV